MRSITVFALLIFSVAAGAAEAWRWVDKNGVTHYGDQQAENAKWIEVKPGSGKGADADTLARRAACQKQKDELESLRTAQVLQQVDALGNARTFTDAERLKILELNEKKVAELCGPAPATPPAAPATPAPANPAATTPAPP